MSQTRCLAAPVAVNRTYLRKLEKGASYPGLEIVAKLATALEVEPASCSGGDGGGTDQGERP
jgi:hypothetical protein